MSYDLSSGQLATKLAETGVALSASTIQRYARTGRLPAKLSPGGRYRYNLDEVHAALAPVSSTGSLTGAVLTGGLGVGGELVASSSDRLRTAARAHLTDPQVGVAASGQAPAPVHDQLTHAATRVLALA